MISTRSSEPEFILYPPYPPTGGFRISSPPSDDFLSFEDEIEDLLNRARTPGLRLLVTKQIEDMLRTFKEDHGHSAYYGDIEGESVW